MNIEIKDKELARRYVPRNTTAAFRIFDSCRSDSFFSRNNYFDLKPNKNYLYEFRYTFDDVNPKEGWTKEELKEYVLFNKNIANKVLKDFASCKDNIETLMVHCVHGQSRSAAMALALNRIFKLDQDPNQFLDELSNPNEFVYTTLLETALKKRY